MLSTKNISTPYSNSMAKNDPHDVGVQRIERAEMEDPANFPGFDLLSSRLEIDQDEETFVFSK